MTGTELILSREALIAAGDAGQTFKYVFFWGHTERDLDVVSAACLSQWYPSPFEADGVRYATAEHYMMAGKARLFGDDEMLEQILSAGSPAEAKKLGRKVRHFDHEAWTAACFDIVVAGNVAKFSADARLRDYLVGTGERVLVEASPRDRIWGIGMGKNNPAASNPREWRGKNLLGFALMKARRALRDGA